jgi:hypothetical protein
VAPFAIAIFLSVGACQTNAPGITTEGDAAGASGTAVGGTAGTGAAGAGGGGGAAGSAGGATGGGGPVQTDGSDGFRAGLQANGSITYVRVK